MEKANWIFVEGTRITSRLSLKNDVIPAALYNNLI